MVNSSDVHEAETPFTVRIIGLDLLRSTSNVCFLLNQQPTKEWQQAFQEAEALRFLNSDIDHWTVGLESRCMYVPFDQLTASNGYADLEALINYANQQVRQDLEAQREQERIAREKIKRFRQQVARFANDHGIPILGQGG